jgi:hypothetical protein
MEMITVVNEVERAVNNIAVVNAFLFVWVVKSTFFVPRLFAIEYASSASLTLLRQLFALRRACKSCHARLSRQMSTHSVAYPPICLLPFLAKAPKFWLHGQLPV